MMRRLHIYDRRERMLVRAADAMLAPIGWARRTVRNTSIQPPPTRVLCLRIERIGDLLMTIPAIVDLRRLAPAAEIDLVVGRWNRELAAAIPGVTRVESLDAEWLTRDNSGRGLGSLLGYARRWRGHGYDLAINFEPDIRTNLLAAASGARRTIGFSTGGGAPVLDFTVEHDPRAHTSDNLVNLVRAAFGAAGGPAPQASLNIPEDAQRQADALLSRLPSRPIVGVHVSGGRAIKQWPVDRFAELAGRLVRERDASLVLTGTAADAAPIARVAAELPAHRVLDISSGHDLLVVAAVLRRLDLFVTGDTGPMHLAHTVGTPIVAIFGPSDPARYAPRGTRDRVVRIDLPCSPCNRIRLPPARCVGHTPDCLAFIDTARVWAAIGDALDEARSQSAGAPAGIVPR